MAEASRRAQAVPGTSPVHLYKNNTDNKGASYGCHENYLMPRSTPFGDIVRVLTPFFVTRQVVCGAGRVGIGADGSGSGFQISQRADFFEVEVGLETTLKRPIINTRDEPHADPEKYRRLHVIIGDANMSEISTYLKLGSTALVIAMIEDGWLTGETGVDLSVENPVASLRAVSHDPSLTHLLRLRDGRRMTAVQVQMEFLDQARKYVADRFGADADDQTKDVLSRWESVLVRLDDDPAGAPGELDWVAKLELLEGFRARDGLDWTSPRLQLIDLQYSDVRADKGLYNRLVARGRMERAARRGGGEPGDDAAPDRHSRVLPGALPGEVPEPSGGRVLGFCDLRRRSRVIAARAHAGADARDPGPRRPPARRIGDRQRAGRPADRTALR